MSRLQMHPIANDHRLVEGEPWLGAVPIDEFVDGVAIAPLRIWARQTAENRGFRDFKIWQPQDRFGGASFGFASLYLLHDPWPPPPRVDHAPANPKLSPVCASSAHDASCLPRLNAARVQHSEIAVRRNLGYITLLTPGWHHRDPLFEVGSRTETLQG